MMNKKMFSLVAMLIMCVAITACSQTKNENAGVPDAENSVNVSGTEATEGVETEREDETEIERDTEAVGAVPEQTVVTPLPTTISLDTLDECAVAVSLEEGDAYVDDTGVMRMAVTVYVYDLYDMVDMSLLKEGDSIVILEEEILITSIERTESGAVLLNGGLDNGGYEFGHDNSGVFYQIGYSDVKSYYPIGEVTLQVSQDFKFVDSSNLDEESVTYYPGDFLNNDAGIMYYFAPDNTSIVIEDGVVIEMNRIYTP